MLYHIITTYRFSLLGPPDPSKTEFHLRAPNLILKCGTFHPILFSPKDSFGNVASVNEDQIVFESRKVRICTDSKTCKNFRCLCRFYALSCHFLFISLNLYFSYC